MSSTVTSDDRPRVAILFPVDPAHGLATDLMQSRSAAVARAIGDAGLDAMGAPYADVILNDVRAQLHSVDLVLVWLNPVEGGRDRTVLNTKLRDVAAYGAIVSADPGCRTRGS